MSRLFVFSNGSLSNHPRSLQGLSICPKRVSLVISVHGSNAATHDAIVQSEGSFRAAEQLLLWARQKGIATLINTAVTATNIDDIPGLLELSGSFGALFHTFLLAHSLADPAVKGATLSDFAAALKRTDPGHRSRLRSEGLPLCYLKNHEDICGELCWPVDHRIVSRNGREFDYRHDILPLARRKAACCGGCFVRNECHGVYRELLPELERNPLVPML
jgi:MoaA/NifB/PqqE/SkfB family radical SAM enzyme